MNWASSSLKTLAKTSGPFILSPTFEGPAPHFPQVMAKVVGALFSRSKVYLKGSWDMFYPRWVFGGLSKASLCPSPLTSSPLPCFR